MNNTVTLYKTEWLYGSTTQPYFKSISSRDNYLKSLEGLEVLNNVNVNILKNYDVNFKVPVDISQCENYNFLSFTYNNKIYFADIQDYEQLSVGYTKIYCHRNVLWEYPNYFQYFNNFYITKRTYNSFKNGYPSYTSLSTYKFPSLRYYETSTNELYFINNDDYKPYFVLFIDPIGIDASVNDLYYVNNVATNFVCIIFDPLILNSNETLVEHFNRLTPYIYSAEWVLMKTISIDNKRFVIRNVLENSEIKYRYVIMRYSNNSSSYGDLFKTFGYGLNIASYILDINDNKIELDKIKYGDSCTVEIYQSILPGGSCYNILIKSTDGKHEQDIFTIPLNNIIPYCVPSSANFQASNKYYDKLTNIQLNRVATNTVVDSSTEFLTGLTQVIGGIRMSGSIENALGGGNLAKVGTTVSGMGNIYRSVGTAVKGAFEYDYYKQERTAIKQQAMESPGTFSSGGGFISALRNRYIGVLTTKYILQNDLDEFINNLKYNGIECADYIKTSPLDFDDIIINNNFAFKGVADKNNLVIPTLIYSEMRDIMAQEHIYTLI